MTGDAKQSLSEIFRIFFRDHLNLPFGFARAFINTQLQLGGAAKTRPRKGQTIAWFPFCA